MRKCISWCE